MARSGATNREIATILGRKRSFIRKIRQHLELERATRRFEFRKKQTELALNGNEQMLRILGEIELEQAKKDRRAAGPPLPDLDRYPETGYPPGDPRTLAMDQNRRVQAEDLLRFARFIAAYARQNPRASWLDCLNAIAEACGVEFIQESDQASPPTWQQALAQLQLAGTDSV